MLNRERLRRATNVALSMERKGQSFRRERSFSDVLVGGWKAYGWQQWDAQGRETFSFIRASGFYFFDGDFLDILTAASPTATSRIAAK